MAELSGLTSNIARAQWVKKVLEIARRLSTSRNVALYDVQRGAIDWVSYTWPKSRAMSVRTPEVFPQEADGRRSATLQITAACRISLGQIEGFDDTVLDSLEEDCIKVAQALLQAQKASSLDSLVLDVDHVGSVEFADWERKVQGFFVTFSVDY